MIGKTQEERTADLYRANVVKYLIVPEDSDVELPVGIEKEMIVVNLPVKHAYVDSEESLKTTDELKLLKKIAAVGFDQDETDIDAVNKALEEKDMIYAGSGEDLKFRELVKNKVGLAIVSSETFREARQKKQRKKRKRKTARQRRLRILPQTRRTVRQRQRTARQQLLTPIQKKSRYWILWQITLQRWEYR